MLIFRCFVLSVIVLSGCDYLKNIGAVVVEGDVFVRLASGETTPHGGVEVALIDPRVRVEFDALQTEFKSRTEQRADSFRELEVARSSLEVSRADAEALVNSVNCVGYMGKGIALQFKKAFPDNFIAYQKACRQGQVQPGKVLVFHTGSMVHPKYIINLPTKRHWKGPSHLEDVRDGVDALVREVKKLKIGSIAIPPLGCGLGGLDWGVD